MGSSASKNRRNPDDLKGFREKVMLLEDQISESRCKREKESRAYEHQVRVFVIKGAEWKRERKKLREEVRKLRKKVEEKEEIIRGMEGETVMGKSDKEWQLLGANFLVEHMREEQAHRDEAVEKWKRLYLAIKTELDDLIQTTCQGERLYWGVEEEDMMEGLQRDLKAKEETIQVLRAQLAAMEEEKFKKDREVGILRQSLRIMSNTKKVPCVMKGLS